MQNNKVEFSSSQLFLFIEIPHLNTFPDEKTVLQPSTYMLKNDNGLCEKPVPTGANF